MVQKKVCWELFIQMFISKAVSSETAFFPGRNRTAAGDPAAISVPCLQEQFVEQVLQLAYTIHIISQIANYVVSYH